jgi:hypothetical protein
MGAIVKRAPCGEADFQAAKPRYSDNIYYAKVNAHTMFL